MVHCTKEMYENNNYYDFDILEGFEKNLCPDFDALKDIWKVKNAYVNMKDRKSFSIQAVRCNAETGDTSCASKSQIEYLLNRVYFTMYVLEE
jgi:hypothetical protein